MSEVAPDGIRLVLGCAAIVGAIVLSVRPGIIDGMVRDNRRYRENLRRWGWKWGRMTDADYEIERRLFRVVAPLFLLLWGSFVIWTVVG